MTSVTTPKKSSKFWHSRSRQRYRATSWFTLSSPQLSPRTWEASPLRWSTFGSNDLCRSLAHQIRVKVCRKRKPLYITRSTNYGLLVQLWSSFQSLGRYRTSYPSDRKLWLSMVCEQSQSWLLASSNHPVMKSLCSHFAWSERCHFCRRSLSTHCSRSACRATWEAQWSLSRAS